MAIGDFNGDGKNDIATANNSGNSISVLLGLGDGTCAAKVDYLTGDNPIAIVEGDWNGDHQQDLATASATASTVSVLLGNGDGTFSDPQDYDIGAPPTSLAAGDFNGDGQDDLAVAAAPAPRISILLAAADGSFGAPTDYPTTATAYSNSMVVGDFDGDHILDLISGNQDSMELNVLLGKGDGTFAPSADETTAPNHADVVSAGDLNGDDTLDLGIADSGGRGWNGGVSVLLGDGGATFPSHLDVPENEPRTLAMGDVTGDGKLDLAVVSTQGLAVLAGAGDGTFRCSRSFYDAGGAGFVLGDMNGDGRLDVVSYPYASDSVVVFLNLPLAARLLSNTGAVPPSDDGWIDPAESPQQAHYHLALRLAAKGDPNGAIAELERALEIDPAHELSQRQWGLLLERQGALAAAFEHFIEATIIHPEYRDALEDAARVAARLGRSSEAVTLYARARTAIPNSPRRFRYWAAYLHAHGRDAAASDEVAKALAESPGDAEALELARGIQAALSARATRPE